MQYETAVRSGSSYTWRMQIEYTQAMLTEVCMLFIGALAYGAGIISLVGGNHDALLRCTARTMAETIQDVLR